MTTALAAGLVGLAGAPALASSASDPHNCPDFNSQAEGQAELDRVSGYPSGLDRDEDGQACENTDCSSSDGDSSGDDGENSSSSDDDGMAMPSGGVVTGAGGTAGDVSGLLATGGLLAAAGAGGLVLLRRRAEACPLRWAPAPDDGRPPPREAGTPGGVGQVGLEPTTDGL
ncbi:excalibur calcium-binding domain-containing protein [uncultured Pseudokineococcus sp.]|uniref:excalibur calcium-binding domain-containing protein n=1 Tax=uncultured Pseudokineococcus sp. TaxID=1642928 RepID=UPI00342D4F54